MTLEKIDSVLTEYMVKLHDEHSCTSERHNSLLYTSIPFDDEQLNHIYWMCQEVKGWLCAGKKEKAMRWLGFIQGVLWSQGIYKISELKNHNKP